MIERTHIILASILTLSPFCQILGRHVDSSIGPIYAPHGAVALWDSQQSILSLIGHGSEFICIPENFSKTGQSRDIAKDPLIQLHIMI